MTEKPPSIVFVRQAARALLPFALSCLSACIDVGHRAEVGCLVDPTEPGCTPAAPDDDADDESDAAASTQADAATRGAADAAMRTDADAATSADADAGTEPSETGAADAAEAPEAAATWDAQGGEGGTDDASSDDAGASAAAQ